MKIYVTNADITKILNKLKYINACSETKIYFQLYSNDGVFKVNEIDNTINQLNYVDGITKTISINRFNIILDTSEINYLIDISQIPYSHHAKTVTEVIWKLSKYSKLKLIIIYLDIDVNPDVFDFYFEYDYKEQTNLDSISDGNIIFKEDLLTFLS